jgi:hypothetical protein
MSKKKACFYTLTELAANRPYATIEFYDHKERRMLSSVDVVLNMAYHDASSIAQFVASR